MTDTSRSPLVSERGRALILAAAVLDRPSADPDDDMAVLKLLGVVGVMNGPQKRIRLFAIYRRLEQQATLI